MGEDRNRLKVINGEDKVCGWWNLIRSKKGSEMLSRRERRGWKGTS